MAVPARSVQRGTSNIARLLSDTAAVSAGRIAIEERDGASDYATLLARSGAVCEALRAAGVTPTDRVGIFLERGRDAAAAFFGTVALGAIAININETLRPRQIEHILRHAGVRVLLTSEELLARLPRPAESDASVVRLDDIPLAGEFDPVNRVETDVAKIIYTSGSTGLPKGVTIAHANLWAGISAVTTYLRLTADDRIASLLPFSFDYGFNQLMCAVGLGATLVVERSPLPQQIVDTLVERQVSVLPAVPPLWLQLLNVNAFRHSRMESLRVLTNTGGRMPVPAVRALREAQPQAKLFLMYGLTEAFRSTYLSPEEVDRRPDSMGRAIPGAQVLVLNERLEECQPGEVGELVHRGPTVALGYWDDPEATARVYRPNPTLPVGAPGNERVVFSGDLVRRDEEGFIYFVGRRDGMIKSLGFRVSPDEIVDVLHASGEILEALVDTEPHEQRGDRIIAYVVLKSGSSLDRLKRYCGTELPRYMQPGRFETRDELPRTASGKHDVKAVSARYTDA